MWITYVCMAKPQTSELMCTDLTFCTNKWHEHIAIVWINNTRTIVGMQAILFIFNAYRLVLNVGLRGRQTYNDECPKLTIYLNHLLLHNDWSFSIQYSWSSKNKAIHKIEHLEYLLPSSIRLSSTLDLANLHGLKYFIFVNHFNMYWDSIRLPYNYNKALLYHYLL